MNGEYIGRFNRSDEFEILELQAIRPGGVQWLYSLGFWTYLGESEVILIHWGALQPHDLVDVWQTTEGTRALAQSPDEPLFASGPVKTMFWEPDDLSVNPPKPPPYLIRSCSCRELHRYEEPHGKVNCRQATAGQQYAIVSASQGDAPGGQGTGSGGEAVTYNKIGPLRPQENHQITWRPYGTVKDIDQEFINYVDDFDHIQARLYYRDGIAPEQVWLKEVLVGMNVPQALAQSPDEPLKIDGRDFTDSDRIMTLYGSGSADPRMIRDCPHTSVHKYMEGKAQCRDALTASVAGYEVCTEEPTDATHAHSEAPSTQ